MDTDWQKRTLPELCMVLHMECSGSSQDMTRDGMAACAEYIRGRVGRWDVHSHGGRIAFDTAVLSLCIATLAEFDEWRKKFPAVMSAIQ